MREQDVDIAFGIGAEFVPHVAAAISSIVCHAPNARLRFIVLHDGLKSERRAMVETVAPNARFHWIEIGEDDVPPYRNRAHFSRPILYRLGLEKLAPSDCRRVIYLDADVIVLRNLIDLWRVDLGGCPLAAVPDTCAFHKSYPIDFAKRWGLSVEKGNYMNSGVLLIDLDEIRREKAFTRMISFVAEHGDDLLFPDQDALNEVLWGRFLPLGNEWNASRDRVIASLAKTLPPDKRLNGRAPAIVHYSDRHKPWHNVGYHPWSWLYWCYLARTPFFHEVAATYGVGRLRRLRYWLRWLRRAPPNLRSFSAMRC